MQNTITIKETPFPVNEEIVTGGIELVLGISALILIIILLVRNIHFQNEKELLKQRVLESREAYRVLYSRYVNYENKFYKLEEVIRNIDGKCNEKKE